MSRFSFPHLGLIFGESPDVEARDDRVTNDYQTDASSRVAISSAASQNHRTGKGTGIAAEGISLKLANSSSQKSFLNFVHLKFVQNFT